MLIYIVLMNIHFFMAFVKIMFYCSGSRDYFTDAFNISDFSRMVERCNDDYNLICIQTVPNSAFIMNGSDICHGDFPERYSFLFKLKVNSNSFAVTLFEIEGQFSITLDLCRPMVIVTYDDSECKVKRRELRLGSALEVGKWHKIGLSFSEDGIVLHMNSEPVLQDPAPICSVSCNEDTHVSMLVPGESKLFQSDSLCSQSGGDGKVRSKERRVGSVL